MDSMGGMIKPISGQAGLPLGYSPVGGGGGCWKNHPLLPIEVEGQTFFITGGSCTYVQPSQIETYDVFVGLDRGMVLSKMSLPWTDGTQFLYPITDMQAPASAETFHQLIGYLSNSITEGLNVFVGCIGGHGRTGTVLAALVAHMTGRKDAIQYVRDAYCKKAVESQAQVDFLVKHYGVDPVEPAKTHSWSGSKGVSISSTGTRLYKHAAHKFCIAKDAGTVGVLTNKTK